MQRVQRVPGSSPGGTEAILLQLHAEFCKNILCVQCKTPNNEPQDSKSIRPNQIMKKKKDNYLKHWKELTKKQSKLECYLALSREYTMAEYLTTVTDPNLRKALTM